MKFLGLNLAVLSLALFASIPSANACGIDWNVPTNHFDGVNEMGEFSIWRDAGQIDFGSDLKIPLIIGFKPNRGGISCLGRGWILPILESNIVQIDETKFLLTQPDGITRRFGRKTPEDTALMGQGNWMGEIKGNTINLWADCGWKLAFFKGKIVSITTPKNRVLNVMYANGQVTEIQEQGRTALKVERDLNGEVIGLSFGTNHIGIKMGERPIVNVIQGANVAGGSEKSLNILTLTHKNQTIYEFGVDEKVQPTLKISGGSSRSFTWNPLSGGLLKDGEWSYDIKTAADRWANAAIGRTNAQKQSEYWFKDKRNGREIVQEINGVKKIATWFTSGKLAGAIRNREEIADGKSHIIYQASYNEKGKLSRETLENGEVNQFLYDDQGTLKTRMRFGSNGIKKETMEFKDGRISAIISSDGYFAEYLYDVKGREIKATINKTSNQKISNENTIMQAKLVKESEYSADFGKIVRFKTDNGITEYNFDSLGKLQEILIK